MSNNKLVKYNDSLLARYKNPLQKLRVIPEAIRRKFTKPKDFENKSTKEILKNIDNKYNDYGPPYALSLGDQKEVKEALESRETDDDRKAIIEALVNKEEYGYIYSEDLGNCIACLEKDNEKQGYIDKYKQILCGIPNDKKSDKRDTRGLIETISSIKDDNLKRQIFLDNINSFKIEEELSFALGKIISSYQDEGLRIKETRKIFGCFF